MLSEVSQTEKAKYRTIQFIGGARVVRFIETKSWNGGCQGSGSGGVVGWGAVV